jgi:hypothetical protein
MCVHLLVNWIVRKGNFTAWVISEIPCSSGQWYEHPCPLSINPAGHANMTYHQTSHFVHSRFWMLSEQLDTVSLNRNKGLIFVMAIWCFNAGKKNTLTRYATYYNVTLWRVRVITVAVETQQWVLSVLLSHMSLSTIKNIGCCTTMLSW